MGHPLTLLFLAACIFLRNFQSNKLSHSRSVTGTKNTTREKAKQTVKRHKQLSEAPMASFVEWVRILVLKLQLGLVNGSDTTPQVNRLDLHRHAEML